MKSGRCSRTGGRRRLGSGGTEEGSQRAGDQPPPLPYGDDVPIQELVLNQSLLHFVCRLLAL